MTRRTRQVGTLVLTAAAIAYLVWKVNLGTTLDVLADTNLAWFALAVVIMVATVPVLALRWGWLLASHAIHERVPWLTRTYFVAYTAGQVLPTSLGGDAVRVVETTRRHPGRATVVTGTVLLERGLGGGWNIGIRETTARYVLLLNADAWMTEGSLERLVDFAEARPRAAVVGPRLLNTDDTLQRSVRGFPTVWRLATEYLFLRKLAPRSSALNAFYAGGFDHDEVRSVEVVMGACMLLRRDAVDQVGECDEDYFLFSEETDWCYRFRNAGWDVVFFPGAECIHVRGASHSGRLYRENLRGHLLFLWKHRGPRVAERARRLLLVSLRFRSLVFRGERGRAYREGAAWLASGNAATLVGR